MKWNSLLQKTARKVSRKGGDRLKLFSVWGAHLMGQRYIGVFIDPILACNLRCQMCYFSDHAYRATLQGRLTAEDCDQFAANLFPHALRLQIGCGAEPSLAPDLVIRLIQLGKQYKVPFIAVVTNGNLFTSDILQEAVTAGLNELILSLHGVRKETYESLMVGAKWERFISLLESLKKLNNPPAVRLNYTMNKDNIIELSALPDLIRDYPITTVQLRPIQKIGESAYQDFSMEPLLDVYDEIIEPTVRRLQTAGIEVFCPDKKKMSITATPPRHLAKLFEEVTYYYLSPQSNGPGIVDFRKVSFLDYTRKIHLAKKLFHAILLEKNTLSEKALHTTKKLNY